MTTVNRFMIRFAQWYFLPLSILIVISVFLRDIKAMRTGKWNPSDEFVTLWAEDWVKKNKEILDKFD